MLWAIVACTPRDPALAPGSARPAAAGEQRLGTAVAVEAITAPPTETSDTPQPAGGIGGPYPTTVERAAGDASWLVYCQAETDSDGDGRLRVSVGPRGDLTGDKLEMRLALGARAPLPIDALWAVDPTERWLLVEAEGRIEVIDSKTSQVSEFDARDADTVESGETLLPHRSLVLDRRGRLVFSRQSSGGGFEVSSWPATEWLFRGRGKLVRTRVSDDAAWWVIESVDRDTNENGRLDVPLPRRARRSRCRGAFQKFPTWQFQADAVTTRVMSAVSGSVYRVKDFAGPLGDGFMFRDESGALWLRRGKRRVRLAPAECGAQVVHADASRGLALVACRGPQLDERAVARRKRRKSPPVPPRARYPIWLVGDGVYLDLKLELGPTGADRWATTSPRLVPIHAGVERRLLDMDTKTLLPLLPTDSVVATFGTHALLIREGEVELTDPIERRSLLEVADIDVLPTLLVSSPVAWVSPVVLDLARGVVLGSTEGAVYALSTDGRVLQSSHQAKGDELPLGPLLWKTPRAD